jgi:hypothetical protein
MRNDIWQEIKENPVLDTVVGELYESMLLNEDEQEQQQPQPEGEDTGGASQEEIDKLANDLKQKHLSQDDLVNMYKSGKLTQDNIKSIIDIVEGGEQGDDQGGEQPMDAEPQSEEELMAQQIDQTNDLFIKFTLYDKTLELMSKLDYFKENFNDVKSDMYERVMQLREFLNILTTLIFNLETTVAYQMYGSLLLQLTEIFKEYNEKDQVIEDRRDKQQEITKDLVDDGKVEIGDVDQWAEKKVVHPDFKDMQ